MLLSHVSSLITTTFFQGFYSSAIQTIAVVQYCVTDAMLGFDSFSRLREGQKFPTARTLALQITHRKIYLALHRDCKLSILHLDITSVTLMSITR